MQSTQSTSREEILLQSLNESGHPTQSSPAVSEPTRRYQALLLVSGFMMVFHVIGINSVYGIFQEYYTSSSSHVKDAYQRDALVSLIGSTAYGLTWSGSIFVNPLIARTEKLWTITVPGVVLMSMGLIAASFCTAIWQLYLTQALLYGVGASMYYFPIMSVSPVYFNRHRGFAMGVILAGSGVGGLAMATVLQHLTQTWGCPWALRFIGIWNMVVGLPVACVIRHRPGYGSRGTSTRMNINLAKRGTFLYQSAAAFLQAAGNVVPMYYLTTYSVSVLALSRQQGSFLLAVNNAVNSISRICMGILADRVGRQNTMVISVVLSGISVFALWYDAPHARFISFTIMYGIYAGGYNALLPTTITDVYGIQNYASVNGFIYFIRGLGSVLGAPLAGLILGSYKRGGQVLSSTAIHQLQKRYNGVVIYDGVLLLCAGVCVAAVRFLDAREKGVWKWKA